MDRDMARNEGREKRQSKVMESFEGRDKELVLDAENQWRYMKRHGLSSERELYFCSRSE